MNTELKYDHFMVILQMQVHAVQNQGMGSFFPFSSKISHIIQM